MSVREATAPNGVPVLQRRVFPTELGPAVVRVQQAAGTWVTGPTADVYLHGAAGCWTTFLPFLAEAAARDRVLIDLPGWGDSTQGARLDDFSIDAMGRVVAGILESLGYAGWHLLGHSMGGFLALHLAAEWPERTFSVATISATTFGVTEATRRPLRGLMRLPYFVGMSLAMRSAEALGTAGSALIRAISGTVFMKLLLSPLFALPADVPEWMIRGLGEDARPASFTAAVRAAAAYDFDRWRNIRCPVLALRGDHDVFTPASDFARLAELVPGIRLATVPGCGHFAIIEQPKRVKALLEDLVQPVADRDASPGFAPAPDKRH